MEAHGCRDEDTKIRKYALTSLRSGREVEREGTGAGGAEGEELGLVCKNK